MSANLIALLSDLGTKDYFVGAMKGVILTINPEVKIIDISHELPRHDVRIAALTLLNAAITFPRGSIFVVVVDPGVGTERKCILLETKNTLRFVTPDNGVLTLVAREFGISSVREITNKSLMRAEVSPTFHGRDIMAPVAAHLSLGVDPSEVGPELGSIQTVDFPSPEWLGDRLKGHVLSVDGFGNLLTDIGSELVHRFAKLGNGLRIRFESGEIRAKLARTFGEVGKGEYLCYIGSTGMLEIAKNMGDLAGEVGVGVGSELVLMRENDEI